MSLVAPDVTPRRTNGAQPLNAGNHSGLLIASTLIVLASMVMNIRGEDKVRILGFSELPQMCQFRNLFNVPCPGCGLTRSFVSMGHMDFVGAWNYHPVGVFFYAVVVFQIPFRIAQIVRYRKGLSPIFLGTAPLWIWGFLATAAFVQWFLRIL